ncbi:hypothetical protein [Metasolibacillus sp.]|uniref:hypothetical protein n=1 Tax=Metasolibacillus sp. TaxID=2703680 RepID=UPI0025E99E15|nr:hypothetical protein [Metasolibacillus sp.]MCT6925415.1 hypothetical protein [Metasolibacillus sp.]MCT6941558.1 hypothetical protein [Metasolibacillus sp.]
MQELFIRLDMDGHWRGADHRSSIQGVAEEGFWEEGVSCYSLKELYRLEAMADLYDYWINYASLNVNDIERCNIQVTIFEGEMLNSSGMNGEDLAICHKTIVQFDAKELYVKWREIEQRWEDDMQTEASFGKEYIKENAEEIFSIIQKHLPTQI